MDQVRDPAFEENFQVFDQVVSYTRDLAGDSATYQQEDVHHGRIGVFDAWPVNPRARHISLIAEQFFILTVGDEGGRWEMGYSDEDVALVRDIIAATVAGRITERSAPGRSLVEVTLDDGRVETSIGYGAVLASWPFRPGWKRRGPLTRYEPYRIG